MGYDPAGIPPEEEVLWTDAELAAPSADEMLGFQRTPDKGELWVPGRGKLRPRVIVAFRPAAQDGSRLARVAYQIVMGPDDYGPVRETYLSCFHAWSRMNHAAPTGDE